MRIFHKNRRTRHRRSKSGLWLALLIVAALGYSWLFPAESTPRQSSSTAAGAQATAIQGAATAIQPRESGCYPWAEALVHGKLKIRAEPSTSARILGTTPPGERYTVAASRQGAAYCWIDIDLGWIAATEHVSGGKASATAAATTQAASRSTAEQGRAAPATPDDSVQRALEALSQLVVADERRCSPYDSGEYSYPQSVEARIVSQLGGRVYSPYTGRTFSSAKETDIEHIVAKSEAHDSGLCAANEEARRVFARDLLNLTLASPAVNRYQKSGKDFAEWRPARNECWYADAIIKVKTKYSLTVDGREKRALEASLRSCASVEMQ